MSTLRFSVITATWNCGSTVSDCLASVLSQTYPNVEHVVIDGASEDGTLDILRTHRRQLAVLHSEPDAGIYDALNRGLQLATGDVIGFLHADDVYAFPQVLSWVADRFSDPDVDAVFGDLQYVRKDQPDKVVRNWKSSPFTRRRLAWGWMPPHPTLYVRRKWFERIGGFDTRYRIAADYDFILRLFSHGDFQAAHIPHSLVRMRTGGVSNKSLRNLLLKSREDWNALRRSGIGAFGGIGALLWKNIGKLGQFR